MGVTIDRRRRDQPPAKIFLDRIGPALRRDLAPRPDGDDLSTPQEQRPIRDQPVRRAPGDHGRYPAIDEKTFHDSLIWPMGPSSANEISEPGLNDRRWTLRQSIENRPETCA